MNTKNSAKRLSVILNSYSKADKDFVDTMNDVLTRIIRLIIEEGHDLDLDDSECMALVRTLTGISSDILTLTSGSPEAVAALVRIIQDPQGPAAEMTGALKWAEDTVLDYGADYDFDDEECMALVRMLRIIRSDYEAIAAAVDDEADEGAETAEDKPESPAL